MEGNEIMRRKTEPEHDEQNELVLDTPHHTDAALVSGIRQGDERTLREFCERFRPLLLDQSRRLGVARDDREHLVMEFLDDFALRIAAGSIRSAAPSLLVTAFRNRLVDRWRHERGNRRYDNTEGALSEYSIRAAQPTTIADADSAPSRHDRSEERNYGDESDPFAHRADNTNGDEPGIGEVSIVSRMAADLLTQCTPDEQRLVVWVSHGVPLRLIAEWLGVNYSAAKVRWHRLRRKLRILGLAYAKTVSGRDRIELERFLRYAGVTSDASGDPSAGGQQIHA